MSRRKTCPPALAGLILLAVLALGLPAVQRSVAAAPGKVTVKQRRVVVKGADGSARSLPGRKGVQELGEGAVFIPKTLRSPTFLVVADQANAPPGILRKLAPALDAHGLIAVVPKWRSRAGKKADAAEAIGNLQTLLSWIQGRYKVAAGRLYVFGFSEGGASACRLVLEDPSRFSGLILVASPPPEADKQTLAKASGLTALLVRGETDKTCSAEQIEQAGKLLTAAGLTVTRKTVAKAGGEQLVTKHAKVFLEWLKSAAKAADAEPAPSGPLEAAGRLYVGGDYAGAVGAYKKLLSNKSVRVSAAIGLSRAEAMTGKYDEALKTLESVADDASGRADWHLAAAEVLATVGRYEEALARATKANELKPTWAPGIFLRGRVLETLGRKKDAIAVYKTMARTIENDAYRRDARSLVALGQVLDRYAILTGQRASEQASNILNNYFQEAYLKADEKYWPANVAAGMFLLSKNRPQLAAKEFELAGKINKKVPDVHVGLGAIELGRWRFEGCLGQVNQALQINPKHADAMLLKAVCLMQWRKFDQVPPVVEQVLKVNPNHL